MKNIVALLITPIVCLLFAVGLFIVFMAALLRYAFEKEENDEEQQ